MRAIFALATFALFGLSGFALAAPVSLTPAQLDAVTAGANPHTKHNETGNPHGVNPGGNTGGCPTNPNCTPQTGNPHG